MRYKILFQGLIITLIISASALHGIAQTTSIKIKLDTISGYHESVGSVGNADPVKIWPATGSSLDSVLWVIGLPFNYLTKSSLANNSGIRTSDSTHQNDSSPNCTDVPKKLLILEKRIGDSTRLSILRKYNHFLSREIVLTYSSDSLKKWTINTVPDRSLPRLKIPIPYCLNNYLKSEVMELFLLPAKDPNMTFNEQRLNSMPLIVSWETVRIARLENSIIYLHHSTNTLLRDNKIDINIRENGVLQTDKIVESLHYKGIYHVSDTLIVGQRLFTIDSVDHEWKYVYFHPLNEKKESLALPEKYIRELLPYFDKRSELLVIDFWGTWCKPCIAAMPQMKAFFEKAKSKLNFLSVCWDNPQNEANAKAIIIKNKISWPQLFNSRAATQSLTRYLEVQSFPGYMIVSKTGTIIFSDSGSEGFEGLEKQFEKIK